MKHLRRTLGLTALSLALAVPATEAAEHSTVFKAGTEGYYGYRIPAVIQTQSGALIAMCEGRKDKLSDTGNIDVIAKRSEDGGKTWSGIQVIWDDEGNTCGNACPVVDESTGIVWLPLTKNLGIDHETQIIKKTATSTRTVWMTHSKDDGKTWEKPVEITSSVKDPSWGWYATGPGVSIQIQHGPHKGRMVVPSDHSYDDPDGNVRGGPFGYGSHAIYSDDHGKTWQLGGNIRPNCNECQVVELADGRGTLQMNLRSYFGRNRRTYSISKDGGDTWTYPKDETELIEPVCQASILRFSWPTGGAPGVVLFSNPASKKRDHMTIKASLDETNTWPLSLELHAGPAAYSCLVALDDKTAGCLYERGNKSAYEEITFARFAIDELK